jgi:hypothetical protein
LKKFKMAMVTKVQKMLNSNHTVDPFEEWHKNILSLKVIKIFKMSTNIKIKEIVKNSKMNKISMEMDIYRE